MMKLSSENKLFVFNLSLVVGLVMLGILLQKNGFENQPTPAVPGIVSTSSRANFYLLGVASDTPGTQGDNRVSESSTPLVPVQQKTSPPVRRPSGGEEYDEND